MTRHLFVLAALGAVGAVYLGATTPASAHAWTGPGWRHYQFQRYSPWGVPNDFYSRYPYWGRSHHRRWR